MSHVPLCRTIVPLLVVVVGCGKPSAEDSYVRGHGRTVATMPVGTEAQIMDAAVHAAFDVEPGLFLRVHPRRLARTAGDGGGAPTSPALVRALRDRGLVIGTCDPIRSALKDTPRCSGAEAGYVIRASDVFRVSADTLEIHLSAETYGAATGKKPDALRFEKVYQLVKDGERWRVAREARARE